MEQVFPRAPAAPAFPTYRSSRLLALVTIVGTVLLVGVALARAPGNAGAALLFLALGSPFIARPAARAALRAPPETRRARHLAAAASFACGAAATAYLCGATLAYFLDPRGVGNPPVLYPLITLVLGAAIGSFYINEGRDDLRGRANRKRELGLSLAFFLLVFAALAILATHRTPYG